MGEESSTLAPSYRLMNEQIKLISAIQQIENLIALLTGNEYETYMISHLIPVQVELNRQLTNLKQSITIQK